MRWLSDSFYSTDNRGQRRRHDLHDRKAIIESSWGHLDFVVT